MRISDWSSDVCSSDLLNWALGHTRASDWILLAGGGPEVTDPIALGEKVARPLFILEERVKERLDLRVAPVIVAQVGQKRSEEHTSELQSLMRISYAVFCLKKKTSHRTTQG